MQLVPGSTKKKKKITQREGKKRKTNLKGLLNVLCIALYISVSPTLSLSFWSASSPRLPHYKPKTSKKKQPNLILLIIFCGRSSALVLGILVFRAPVLIFLPHHQTLFFFCPAATFKKKTIYPNSVNMMMVMKRAISKKNIYQKTTLAYWRKNWRMFYQEMPNRGCFVSRNLTRTRHGAQQKLFERLFKWCPTNINELSMFYTRIVIPKIRIVFFVNCASLCRSVNNYIKKKVKNCSFLFQTSL